MIKRSFLPPVQPSADGVKAPAPRGRHAEPSILLSPAAVSRWRPCVTRARQCMPLAWSANILEILAKRYSHPPERKSGTVPHQLKMTNSPPTCKIAIFRRRSAAAETKDTQSDPFRERRVTSIDGVNLTLPSLTRPDQLVEPISFAHRRAARAEIGVDHVNSSLLRPSSRARRRTTYRDHRFC